jgi:hypothetical protein
MENHVNRNSPENFMVINIKFSTLFRDVNELSPLEGSL